MHVGTLVLVEDERIVVLVALLQLATREPQHIHAFGRPLQLQDGHRGRDKPDRGLRQGGCRRQKAAQLPQDHGGRGPRALAAHEYHVHVRLRYPVPAHECRGRRPRKAEGVWQDPTTV